MSAPARTVDEVKTALSALLGIPRESIGHYAIVVDRADDVILKFCCDDRAHTAAQLGNAIALLLTEPGESQHKAATS